MNKQVNKSLDVFMYIPVHILNFHKMLMTKIVDIYMANLIFFLLFHCANVIFT